MLRHTETGNSCIMAHIGACCETDKLVPVLTFAGRLLPRQCQAANYGTCANRTAAPELARGQEPCLCVQPVPTRRWLTGHPAQANVTDAAAHSTEHNSYLWLPLPTDELLRSAVYPAVNRPRLSSVYQPKFLLLLMAIVF
jgi:hypothetical protein